MAYKIIVSPSAQKEIEDAIDFYSLHSANAPISFISDLVKSYNILSVNPFFCIRYKNIRAIRLKKFPFSLYYVVNEERQLVRVLSCFHNKRNPIRRPNYQVL